MVIQVIHTKYITTTTGRFPQGLSRATQRLGAWPAAEPFGEAPDEAGPKNHTSTFSEGSSVDLSGCGIVLFGIKYYVCILYVIYNYIHNYKHIFTVSYLLDLENASSKNPVIFKAHFQATYPGGKIDPGTFRDQQVLWSKGVG